METLIEFVEKPDKQESCDQKYILIFSLYIFGIAS